MLPPPAALERVFEDTSEVPENQEKNPYPQGLFGGPQICPRRLTSAPPHHRGRPVSPRTAGLLPSPANHGGMRTTAAVTLAVVALGAASMSPAIGAPKKTITKSYTATAPAPDPSNEAPGSYTVCPQRVPGSFQADAFKVPAAGTLSVEVTGYQGDWDALLMDSDKSELSSSGSGGVGGPEVMDVRFKKPTTV